jgi:molybdopterin synthase catalytic subunit
MPSMFTFVHHPIDDKLIYHVVQNCQNNSLCGGISLFIGQIRADVKNNKFVQAIYYTAYKEMAEKQAYLIISEISQKYELLTVKIVHSLGIVKVSEQCMIVCTASKHRKSAFEACYETVERIKNELPIWGKELFDIEGKDFAWKINT